MPDLVLVGIDGSGPSDAAMEWGIERAVRLGLDLVLLHASDRLDSTVLAADSEDVTTGFLDRAVAAARSRPGIGTVRGLAVEGDAMTELITASTQAAIIVVGSHKTGFLRGRVFGSRSLRLVGGALCPVAIIPESSGRRRRGVTVGVSGTRSSDAAVRFAAGEAAALGEELFLVHGDESTAVTGLDIEVVTRSDVLLAAARELAMATAPGLTVRLRGARQLAAVALADASPTSVLVVLAASSGQGADGTIGATTHDVLMNLAAPTVVVPA
ncbi:universal stress protein [Rathayibacter sp. VKM Ac-2762]|uniref:universal stress protein n=1 Tax=Rathayibacter sp. VKM Ac-2762 TaxID=2609254 RepID=UPI00132EF0A9|nr:universal stress protein [Rathayibacter sp. VKM Ac-2762]QHF21190.1 universal stress protein [Rathayibacter sp. VKM Ac-2762]